MRAPSGVFPFGLDAIVSEGFLFFVERLKQAVTEPGKPIAEQSVYATVANCLMPNGTLYIGNACMLFPDNIDFTCHGVIPAFTLTHFRLSFGCRLGVSFGFTCIADSHNLHTQLLRQSPYGRLRGIYIIFSNIRLGSLKIILYLCNIRVFNTFVCAFRRVPFGAGRISC
jgi:hypothetical protein